jgi:hypothetical protein
MGSCEPTPPHDASCAHQEGDGEKKRKVDAGRDALKDVAPPKLPLTGPAENGVAQTTRECWDTQPGDGNEEEEEGGNAYDQRVEGVDGGTKYLRP